MIIVTESTSPTNKPRGAIKNAARWTGACNVWRGAKAPV